MEPPRCAPWAQVLSGQPVDLLDPQPDQIRLEDIAVALSRAARFNGHTLGAVPYNVAHHSYLCETLLPADTAPMARLAVLLHDAHEAYTGDLVAPFKAAVKVALENSGVVADPVGAIQWMLQEAVCAAAGLRFPHPEIDPLIHEADLRALAIEKRDLLAAEPRAWGDLPDVSEQPKLEPLDAWASAHVFTERARTLIREAGLTPLPGFDR